MSVYLLLFIEFFKIGLFAIGGGLATLPFLYDLAQAYPHWLDAGTIVDMVAVAEATPGPIGVNMATYVGFHVAGIPGALTATGALVLPSVIIIILIAKFLMSFHQSPYVITVFSGLRPVVTALIFLAGLEVFQVAVLNLPAFAATGNVQDLFVWKAVILFGVLLFATNRFPRHPVFYIALSAAAGVIFRF